MGLVYLETLPPSRVLVRSNLFTLKMLCLYMSTSIVDILLILIIETYKIRVHKNIKEKSIMMKDCDPQIWHFVKVHSFSCYFVLNKQTRNYFLLIYQIQSL